VVGRRGKSAPRIPSPRKRLPRIIHIRLVKVLAICLISLFFILVYSAGPSYYNVCRLGGRHTSSDRCVSLCKRLRDALLRYEMSDEAGGWGGGGRSPAA